MGQFSGQSDIDRVRDATDLVRLIGEHVSLRPRGREHVGLCPFHDDRSPSMAVVTHKGNAFYKCHACGAGGDAFDFVQQYHKMDFPEALRFLAERAGIALTPRSSRGRDEENASGDKQAVTRRTIREANAFAAEFFRKVLKHPDAGAVGRDVIARRRISDEMTEQFMLGYAPDAWDKLVSTIGRKGLSPQPFLAAGLLKPRKTGEGSYDAFRNRLIFPILSEVGQPIAFGARAIAKDDEPKYLNSTESAIFQKSQTLYGLHQAKRSIIDARTAIITEGYTDVIACHQHGFTNVVGTLGTALTREHARLLSKFCDTVVLVFDGDEAGQRAADRGVEVFFNEPVDVKICVLPDNLDPDDLLQQEGGRARFEQAVAGAIDALGYKVRRFQQSVAGMSSLSGRQKRLEEFLRELVDLGFGALQGVRKRWVMANLADLLGVSIEELQASVPRPRRAVAPLAPASPNAGDQRTLVGAPGVETPAEPTVVMDEDGNPVVVESEAELPIPVPAIPPARRRAEHEVLGPLLFEPALLCQPIPADEQGQVPITECLAWDQFLDPAARAIARVIWMELAGETAFSVRSVMDRLTDRPARELAVALMIDAERRCGGDAAIVTEQFLTGCRAMLALLEREQHDRQLIERNRSGVPSEEGDSLRALQELIAFRRRHHHIAEVMPRGLR